MTRPVTARKPCKPHDADPLMLALLVANAAGALAIGRQGMEFNLAWQDALACLALAATVVWGWRGSFAARLVGGTGERMQALAQTVRRVKAASPPAVRSPAATASKLEFF